MALREDIHVRSITFQLCCYPLLILVIIIIIISEIRRENYDGFGHFFIIIYRIFAIMRFRSFFLLYVFQFLLLSFFKNRFDFFHCKKYQIFACGDMCFAMMLIPYLHELNYDQTGDFEN